MLHLAHLDRLVDLDLHLLDLERLLHVVERAGLHRLDGGLDRAERGHQDHARTSGWSCFAVFSTSRPVLPPIFRSLTMTSK